ncbi:MAG: DNA repair protein [Acidobacteria bacterium]|nr:MAG: DNA repair protein [Acidobacteriota bacterium]
MKPRLTTPLVVMTIGHSTRPIDVFIQLLRSHGVQRIVDVRTVPRSRHNPQFSRDQLSPSLHSFHIHYIHMPGLGGFRHAQHDSVNTAWQNASFRGYADYMQTPEFRKHLDELIELAQHERIAVMCAEAVPWRCHRSLIADALLVRGIEVQEITSATSTRLHSLTPFAKVQGTHITYPAESGETYADRFSGL